MTNQGRWILQFITRAVRRYLVGPQQHWVFERPAPGWTPPPVELGANQITTYPLFSFPYTSVGKYLRLAAVRMPNLRMRQMHYHAISNWCAQHGFERVSVWGFKHGQVPRYSSVTRDGYIGIGPGAGSHLPGGFALNTFASRAG